MLLSEIITLALLLGTVMPCMAQPAPDSTKQALDSSSTKVAAETIFPSSYDQEVLKKIEESPRSYFVSPDITELIPDSTLRTDLTTQVPYVWLQVKLDDDYSVKEVRVVFCSEPSKGLEQLALDAVKKRRFHPVEEHESWRWLWHRVQFGHESAKRTSGRPRPSSLHVPNQLYHLSEAQCTKPAQSVIRAAFERDSAFISVTSEIWFRVRLGRGKEMQVDTVLCFPCDSEIIAMAEDSLRALTLTPASDSISPNDWLYHRMLVLADADSITPVGKGIPTPLDTLVPPYTVSITEPEMTYQGLPKYPHVSKIRGQVGMVWIKTLVESDGTVRRIIVSKSSGFPELDQAAIEAGRKNRFKPALWKGHPVAIWVTYKMEFKLNE